MCTNRKEENMRKIIRTVLVGMISVLLLGCGSKAPAQNENSDAAKDSKYFTPEVVDGKITLEKSALRNEPTYVNYDSDNVKIQMIAVVASDSTSRISLNTCQSCSPSPMAYFAEENGKLVCKNCGNEFTYDDVGIAAGGCNPMNIEHEENDSQIIISVNTLNQYEDLFKNWQGNYQ